MVLHDLQSIGFDATLWYSALQDHIEWCDACQTFASTSAPSAGGPVVSLDHLLVSVAEFLRDEVT